MSAQQTQPLGECPLCHAPNPKTMSACMTCGRRLPWAEDLDKARRAQQAAQQAAKTAPAASGPLPPAPSTPSPTVEGLHPLVAVGATMMALGLLAAGYFFLFFDTSVSGSFAGSSFRVNNIGLMAQRQNGILIGMGSAIVGAILFAVGKSLPPPQVASNRPSPVFYVIAGAGVLAIAYGAFYLLQQ